MPGAAQDTTDTYIEIFSWSVLHVVTHNQPVCSSITVTATLCQYGTMIGAVSSKKAGHGLNGALATPTH